MNQWHKAIERRPLNIPLYQKDNVPGSSIRSGIALYDSDTALRIS